MARTDRFIVLEATKKRVPVGAYVAGVRAAIANPTSTFRHGLTTWWPVTGEDIRREFLDGVHDRINRHIPGFGRGRKWAQEWQADAFRTARDVNTPRLAISWLPHDLRARLSHRLTGRNDHA